MDFEAFLFKKRIDSALFRKSRPEEWEKLNVLFETMGEKSFDQHKKFHFNPLRLSFPLHMEAVLESSAPVRQEETIQKPIIPGEEKTTPAPPFKKSPLKAKPVIPTVENEEKTGEEVPVNAPPPSVKKLPLKAKPVIPAVENEEKSGEEVPVNTPPPSVKKLPLKAKPVIPAVKNEEKSGEEVPVNTPPPSVKKLPLKAKPVIPAVKNEEKSGEEVPVNTPPPSVKKLPLKAKPIIKPPEE